MRKSEKMRSLLAVLLVLVLLSGGMAVAMLAGTLSNTVTATGTVLSPVVQEISLDGETWGTRVEFSYGNESDYAGGATVPVYIRTQNRLDRSLSIESQLAVTKPSGTSAELARFKAATFDGVPLDKDVNPAAFEVVGAWGSNATQKTLTVVFGQQHYKPQGPPQGASSTFAVELVGVRVIA